ncbi:MAG: hypothetical protein QF391_12900, partial [Myxococcota bacterium]|nr:hypothetical protein [Myxococcota bacterium]
MQIDEAGSHYQPPGVEDLVGLARIDAADSGDAAVANRDVTDEARRAQAVYHRPALDYPIEY